MSQIGFDFCSWYWYALSTREGMTCGLILIVQKGSTGILALLNSFEKSVYVITQWKEIRNVISSVSGLGILWNFWSVRAFTQQSLHTAEPSLHTTYNVILYWIRRQVENPLDVMAIQVHCRMWSNQGPECGVKWKWPKHPVEIRQANARDVAVMKLYHMA